MKQPITGFFLDEKNHWVARLACGHTRHVRHDPPWQNRSWVITEAGRAAWIGSTLDCKKCEAERQNMMGGNVTRDSEKSAR
jgi:hypothetical protein